MHHKFLVVSPPQFMRSYMPPVAAQRNGRFSNILKDVPVASGQELKMYKPLVDALNKARICPNFTFATTAARGDPSDDSNEAVDIGLYPADEVPQPSKGSGGKILSPHTDWSRIELYVECKTDAEKVDPFDEMKADNEPNTEDRKAVLGQILSYVEFMLKRQQRTCVFVVLLLGNFCRLARFDRAGAIVTEKFNYKTSGDGLIEFLWRYARCVPAQRGHDSSAERVKPSSSLGQKMQARAQKDKDLSKPEDYVRQMFEQSLDPRWSWWKLRVDGEHGKRFFLVGKPNFQAPGIAGRGTRGYVAVDADDIDGPFYYLKDAWRVVSRSVDKEGTILQSLNTKGVRYIPTLECHGDIAADQLQWTQTNKLWVTLNKDGLKKKGVVSPFKKHRHYRIVVKEVGRPMSEFKSGKQLIWVLWCCVYAHYMAYQVGVIHRDISAGNVLLYYDQRKKKWVGLLNDWELSKKTKSNRPTGRQLDRTGTWQFMSARALDDPGKTIVVEDELESFFHVLIFSCIRYLHHNCDKVAQLMHDYFDDYSARDSGGYTCGSFKMLCMTRGYISLRTQSSKTSTEDTIAHSLKFLWPPSRDRPGEVVSRPHPMNEVVNTILLWLKAYYSLIKQPDDDTAKPNPEEQIMDGEVDDDEFTFDDEEDGPGFQRKVQLSPGEGVSPEQELATAKATAENLRTHEALLALLQQALESATPWPKNDKKGDQLPKQGYKHGADLPSADLLKQPHGSMHANPPAAGPSRKRTSEQIEQPAVQEQQKRSKTPPRRSTRRTRSRN